MTALSAEGGVEGMRAGNEQVVERDPSRSFHHRQTDVAECEEAIGGASLGVAMHLHELVPLVRARLRLGPGLPEEAVLASLAAITSRSVPRERWTVAFNSALGRFLARRGSDLASSLGLVMALLPPPRS